MQTPPPLLRWPRIDPQRVADVVKLNSKSPANLGAALLAVCGIDIQIQPARRPVPVSVYAPFRTWGPTRWLSMGNCGMSSACRWTVCGWTV